MKICLVCAPGGHLTEMLRLNDAFVSHDVFLVTYKEEFLNLPKNVKKTYLIKNILVGRVQANRVEKIFLIILQMLLSAVKEFRILLIEKPDVIISTGSEIAIPICYMAKIFGKKVIFIESLCRINNLSGTGKIVSPISDVFLVQWESLVGKCKKAQYKGNVLSTNISPDQNNRLNKKSFIFVTVGTAPFPRLVEKMDEISKTLEEQVIMQVGKTNYKPKNAEYFNFVEQYEKIRELNKKAKVVISHAGVGSIMTALEEGAPLILVPRLKKYGEHNDDHQSEIAKMLKEQKLAEVAYEIEDVPYILSSFNDKTPQKNQEIENQKRLNEFLKSFLFTNFEEKKLVESSK